MADYTKSEGEILDWTLLDDTGSNTPFAETGLQTKSDEMVQDLFVTVAHADANDAAAAHVTVTVLGRLGADDEAWREIVSFQSGGGQAAAEALNANSGMSEANPERIEVADTTDWDTGFPEWLFLQDAGTLVDSCLVLVKGWVDNDYYICAWGLERDYDSADSLYDNVSQHRIRIPDGVQYFNVVFHNADDDATYAVRVDFAEVDDLV